MNLPNAKELKNDKRDVATQEMKDCIVRSIIKANERGDNCVNISSAKWTIIDGKIVDTDYEGIKQWLRNNGYRIETCGVLNNMENACW